MNTETASTITIPIQAKPLEFFNMLATGNAGARVLLTLMPNKTLIELVRSIDAYSWQWRHRRAVNELLHELADRLGNEQEIP